MTPRPWKVLIHRYGRPVRVVKSYATQARAIAEADRCNCIIARERIVGWYYSTSYRKVRR